MSFELRRLKAEILAFYFLVLSVLWTFRKVALFDILSTLNLLSSIRLHFIIFLSHGRKICEKCLICVHESVVWKKFLFLDV